MRKLELSIDKLRKQKGWSQAELGKRIGKSQQQVYVIENGNTLKLDVLVRLMDVFEVDNVSELFVIYEKIDK